MESNNGFTTAIVVAAGSSTRMGVPKQFLTLGDRPVIAHTLAAFEKSASINEIVLVARPDDIDTLRELAREYAITKLSAIVPGGDTRRLSVANGVRACSPQTAILAIHDGARPLVSQNGISAVVEAAKTGGAAALAVRVKDTIKVADANGVVVSTPDRATLWSVQTPQVFGRDLYLRAMEFADANALEVTDDCQMVEAVGFPIRLVEGEYTNLKITTPEDIRVAEGWLR